VRLRGGGGRRAYAEADDGGGPAAAAAAAALEERIAFAHRSHAACREAADALARARAAWAAYEADTRTKARIERSAQAQPGPAGREQYT
jgi:hypothetical protein